MKSKINKTLKEVWDMEDKVYEDFKNSNYTSFVDFIENDVKEIKKKYNIKNRREAKEVID